MPGPQILVKNQDTARWEAWFSYFTKKILHRKNSTIDSIIIELDANRILSHVAPIFLDNGYFFANFQNKIFLEGIFSRTQYMDSYGASAHSSGGPAGCCMVPHECTLPGVRCGRLYPVLKLGTSFVSVFFI